MKASFAYRRSVVKAKRALKALADCLRKMFKQMMDWADKYRSHIQAQTKLRPAYGRNGKPLKSWQAW